jgi:predicted amidophosphoribosyltransferase
VVLASRCAACDDLLPHPTRGAVCEVCWGAIPRITPPFCARCGLSLPSWRASALAAGVCARCRRAPGPVDAARSLGSYEGSLRAIVHALKYGRRPSLARRLGELVAGAGRDVLDGAEALVPVPLHPIREWQRGFNQADLIARAIGGPVARVLCRVRRTPPQASLPAARRRANLRGAFALAPLGTWPAVLRWADACQGLPDRRVRQRISGRCLVIVDDVSTTGATIDECARVLKAAGAREVRALTAARAVLGRP